MRGRVVALAFGFAIPGVALLLRLGGPGGDAAAPPSAAPRIRVAPGPSTADVAVPVRAAVVRRDTFVLWVEAQGRAAPPRRADLEAEVSGAVLEVSAREGRSVVAGAALVRIDPAEHRLQLRRAEAELEAAEARFRELTLFDDRIGDRSLGRERERHARIRSGLPEARVALERARRKLARTEVRAPFAGRVANLAARVGSRVRHGDSLLTVLDVSRVDVDVRVLYSRVPDLEPGRRARVTFPALPGEAFEGRVATINPLIDPHSQTARVTVRLDGPGTGILPGMPAEARIAGRLLEGRTFVPREAIVDRDRRAVVFVFEPAGPGSDVGLAKWRYVTTGAESDRFVEIVASEETGMLEEGQVVLVDGHATLVHDARVRIENRGELGAAPGRAGPDASSDDGGPDARSDDGDPDASSKRTDPGAASDRPHPGADR